jgi:sugar/nucleoside kinase (ribokinase family)
MSDHDVYSFGVIASSTLYAIRGAFPAPEGYAEIGNVSHMIGGEAANSSIVLSRLGARVKLDGNWLGADEAGHRVKALLERFGIDTSRLPLRENCRGVHEVVFTTQGTRTIFGTYVRLLEDEAWNMPVEDDIRRSRVVCLDPFFGKASNRVAEVAHDSGIPVVTVDCLPEEPLVGHASALVVSESYLRSKFPDRPMEAVFGEYLKATGGLVVFTLGENGGWYGRPGAALQRFDAYPVTAVDTTCAGDSFRAGIVFGFLQGWDDPRVVDFAAAVAGIVCTRTPGALNAPGRDETLEFMRSRGSPPGRS